MRLSKKGFTLVELLVVIGIIVLLFAVTLIAIDPAKRLRQARDAVRNQDVRDLLEAVQEFIVDNDGDSPAGLDAIDEDDGGEWRQIIGDGGAAGCSGDIGTVCTNATTEDDCLSMEGDLEPTYFSEIPQDPDGGVENDTMYYIDLNDNGRFKIGACNPEQAATISVTR